jgi:hypothetical protein
MPREQGVKIGDGWRGHNRGGGSLRLGGYGGGVGDLAHSKLLVGWLHCRGLGGVLLPVAGSGLLPPSKGGGSHRLFLLPLVFSILQPPWHRKNGAGGGAQGHGNRTLWIA